MIVWVTGAKGFIGQHLARYLASRGNTVLGIGHGLWPESEEDAKLAYWLNGNVTSNNLTYLQAINGLPDLVVHLAGGSSVGVALDNPFEDFSRTVETTAELLDWLRINSLQTRLIAISSAAVYGVAHLGQIDELSIPKPVSPYGYHKLMMEQLCRSYSDSYGLRCLVLRLFSVYGSGLRKQLLWDICRRLKSLPNSIELSGMGNEQRDWIHISDVVRAIDFITDLPSTEVPIFNVGSGKGTSVREIAQMVIDIFAEDSERSELFFNRNIRVGDPYSLVSKPDKLHSLGFDCSVSPYEGVKEYVHWFMNESVSGLPR